MTEMRRILGGLAALLLGVALAGCAVELGGSGESRPGTAVETARERNRLYMQEQERLERDRLILQGLDRR